MKLIQVHNHYQQPGGEDFSFAAEVDLLRRYGHDVYTYVRHNDEINCISALRNAQRAIWNYSSYKDIKRLIQKVQPDVVHFQNTFIVISPAGYYAAKAEGVPVVQTLRNFRLTCPGALFYRTGKVCEKCRGRLVSLPGIRHACYRRSRFATTVLVLMNCFHRLIGTWKKKIDIYIALTGFSKDKFIQAGFSKKTIVVKPNFVDTDPYISESDLTKKRNGALFVGRLSQEKGITTLLKAWEIIGDSLPLKIVGDGPLKPVVQKAVLNKSNILWIGQKPAKEVFPLMAMAKALIFPSEWYEGMPRTIIESFSQGTPVISSNIGSMTEMVEHGRTGLHFESGNAQDLADKIIWSMEHPAEMNRMGRNARAEYEAKYTPEKNYHMLMAIYEQAIENHHRRQRNIARH